LAVLKKLSDKQELGLKIIIKKPPNLSEIEGRCSLGLLLFMVVFLIG
jgi:hypothetical protein